MIYNANGRRRRVMCPCPKCREPLSEVLNVSAEDGGDTVRQRKCPACGHRWFTLQEPEYIISADKIEWAEKKPRLRQTAYSVAG